MTATRQSSPTCPLSIEIIAAKREDQAKLVCKPSSRARAVLSRVQFRKTQLTTARRAAKKRRGVVGGEVPRPLDAPKAKGASHGCSYVPAGRNSVACDTTATAKRVSVPERYRPLMKAFSSRHEFNVKKSGSARTPALPSRARPPPTTAAFISHPAAFRGKCHAILGSSQAAFLCEFENFESVTHQTIRGCSSTYVTKTSLLWELAIGRATFTTVK